MERKSRMIQILLFLLVSVFVLTALAGCKNNKEPEETEPPEADTGGAYDKDGYLKDSLPNNLDYKFEGISILGWNVDVTGVSEFDIKDMSGDEIEVSIFERDSAVEDRLKVELFYTIAKGDSKNTATYKTTVQNSIHNGKPYDVIEGYTRSVAICATDGLLMDLGNLESSYLDFDAPWWNQSIIEKTSVGNTFYFATGDIAPSFVQMLYCVHFNADLIESLSMQSPYEHVANNTWTLETLMGMTMNFYDDVNTNNIKDLTDKIPLTGLYYDWPALLHGCGIGNMIKDDATDEFILDPALGGEKGLKIMEKLSAMVSLDNCFVGENDDINASFIAEKNLFMVRESSLPIRKFSEVEFEYGCVPCPKYDSTQENYISTARQPVTLVALSTGVKKARIEMISATVEALASESYRSVTPIIFDRVMQYQKAASEEMRQMLILIRDTGWFDAGRIFAADISYLCDQPGRVLQKYPTQTWESYVNGTLNTTVKAQVEKLNETLLKLAGQSK